jgi:hypothetical protein
MSTAVYVVWNDRLSRTVSRREERRSAIQKVEQGEGAVG